jgi:hypothetical protein
MGDYGEISTQSCNCVLGELGFDRCLSGIRSYEKLTGEGVTFVDTDFIRIIERDLPERFGGKSTDYQLVEKEDSRALTHLQLLVSPRIGEIDETMVLNTFLHLLRRSVDSPEAWSHPGTEIWKQSNMVQIVREFPIATASAKILPFFVSKPKSVSDAVCNTASPKI